jgi:hypothetical protein
MTPFILKIAAALRHLWRWSDDHYDVLENGVVVGRISKETAAPQVGVGQRPLGGHGQARRARLWGNPRSCDGRVRQELPGAHREVP